jgi:hypothetical protein
MVNGQYYMHVKMIMVLQKLLATSSTLRCVYFVVDPKVHAHAYSDLATAATATTAVYVSCSTNIAVETSTYQQLCDRGTVHVCCCLAITTASITNTLEY